MQDNRLIIGETGSGKTTLIQELVLERVNQNPDLSVIWCDLLTQKLLTNLPIANFRAISLKDEIEVVISDLRVHHPHPTLVVLDGIDSMQLPQYCWDDIEFFLKEKESNISFVVAAQSFRSVSLRRRNLFSKMLIGRLARNVQILSILFPGANTDELYSQVVNFISEGQRPAILDGELQLLSAR
jgi:DNA segregation ATPase FtsK/SpoIIIE-like protein